MADKIDRVVARRHPHVVDPFRQHLAARLDQQEGKIEGLSLSFAKMQTDMSTGFADAKSTSNTILAKLDSRPAFDLPKTVGLVLHLAILLGMMITGIIWVTTGQFGSVMAKQDSYNVHVLQRLEKHDQLLEKMSERVGWAAQTYAKSKQ